MFSVMSVCLSICSRIWCSQMSCEGVPCSNWDIAHTSISKWAADVQVKGFLVKNAFTEYRWMRHIVEINPKI